MKKIEFRAGSTLEQCYAKIKSEAMRSGEVVCGEFNGVLMRSDVPLAEFYREYHKGCNPDESGSCADNIIDKFATEYANSIPQFEHNKRYSIDDFTAGVKFWATVKRNGGFATEECLDEMFDNLPFLIFDQRDGEINVVLNAEWRGDIDKHPYYSHWKPIIPPKNEN